MKKIRIFIIFIYSFSIYRFCTVCVYVCGILFKNAVIMIAKALINNI